MNIDFRPQGKTGHVFGRLLTTALAVWMAGVVYAPAVAASSSTVPVDTSPLTVQASLPPNIVLMLDDSGSMAWSVMPDYGYLTDQSLQGERNSAVNGVYYDPAVTYTPPPKADSTSTAPDLFPSNSASSFPNAYTDQIGGSTGTSDVTQASGSDGSGYYGNGTFNFYDSLSYGCNKHGRNCSSFNAFAYTGSDGSTHYVASNCNGVSNCVTASDISGVAAPANVPAGQNVMNWYSYYRTRILMAKSGLMSAFSGLNATYRFGFGSIDGGSDGNGNGNSNNLPSGQYSYTDSYNNGTNYIAQVAPFGDGSSSSDQKTAFWNWISKAVASGGTPLRQALNAVGQYYETKQPWTTMSSDTDASKYQNTLLACRQDYTILTTDGFWNGNSPGVGDVDSTAGTAISGANGQSYTYSPALPYSDGTSTVTKNYSHSASSNSDCKNQYTSTTGLSSGYSNSYYSSGWFGGRGTCQFSYQATNSGVANTLADVAMKYWSTDLASGLGGTQDIANEVPTNDADPAFWQHMVTFTIGLGFTPEYADGSAIPVDQVFSWADGKTSDAISGFSWPVPSADNGGSINNIADLAHAGVDGHGGFYSATSPDKFTSGLKDALKRAGERVGTGASLAANSTELQTGTFAYQANYFTGVWKGDLKALAVNPTNGSIAASNDATWYATSELPAAASRNIYTYNPTAAAGSQYVAFSDPTNLSTAEQNALGGTSTDQQNMLNYLRGDQSLEIGQSGGIFRARTTPLGDIVDSQPVYSGAANVNQFNNESFTGSDKFAAYVSTTQSREALIYVASNDGMLHAFDADTGAEKFAYIPAAVITNSTATTGTTDTANDTYVGLSALASPDYGSDSVPHEYFNDGELTVADAYFAEGSDAAAWHTVVVGTTGRGLAKAVYALDVTNPASIKFLWERSAGDGKTNSNYIGQLVGKPIIAQVGDGQWAVLLGNGYNSAAGTSALLQFDLASGSLGVHTTTDTTTGNGLAAPAVWIGNPLDGISTMAYAGDLHGKVWSFPVSKTATTTVTNTDGTTTTTTTNVADTTTQGTLLFQTADANGTAQPITGGMLIGQDPNTQNLWVFFGTGQYLAATDITNTQIQTWYGLIVKSTVDDTLPGQLTSDGNGVNNTNLVQRHIIYEQAAQPANATTGTPATLAARVVSAPVAGDMTGKSGWYMNLGELDTPSTDADGNTTYTATYPDTGERMVTPNQFQGSLLVGTTRIPTATDPCNPSGSGWIMAIEPFTGTNPDPAFFDINGDGVINGSDVVTVGGKSYNVAGVGFTSLPNNPIFVGGNMLTSFDNGTTSSLHTAGAGANLQRVSWRELINQ
ncbi:pilus assembly protein PilY [Rhodanobacter glycinis]|uniref:Pilus assembly protein PilY n=1 Tax=Rhodanobacter glycinis TaxID=582702 RepID=A0A5B9E1B0_9GAMM|nr:PilC/PilY family type IV pilus protein [Rhodanobacter glycinis]QEE24451.1 pilus assembly protein PilY [Rhodanobacter glycinis]